MWANDANAWGSGSKLLSEKPFVWSIGDCSRACDAAGPACSHFSLSLGPAWNYEQAPDVPKGFNLLFTPKAGPPGHCHLCSGETNAGLTRRKFVRDAPGMYSYVGFKKSLDLVDEPPAPTTALGDEGGLVATDPNYLPPHWLHHLHATGW